MCRTAVRPIWHKSNFVKALDEFNDLCADIDDLHETEKLERFKEGLQNEYLREVLRDKPKTFDEAVASALNWDLIQKQVRDKKSGVPSSTAHEPATPQNDPMEIDITRTTTRKGQMSVEERKRHFENGLCFRCHKAGHQSKDCPEKKKKKEKSEEEKGKEAKE